MEAITFWTHPITWTWNALTNALTGRNDTVLIDANENVPLGASGTGAKVTCVITQLFMFAVLVFLLWKFVIKPKFFKK